VRFFGLFFGTFRWIEVPATRSNRTALSLMPGIMIKCTALSLAVTAAVVTANAVASTQDLANSRNGSSAPPRSRSLFSCSGSQVEFSVWFGSVTGLDCKDGYGTGKPDPYVIATIGGNTQTTGTCNECKSWNQWLNFGCVEQSTANLNLKIMDEDGGVNGYLLQLA
jgi:hypothetical protein